MRTRLLLFALLLSPAARGQSGLYVTVASGSEKFSAEGNPSQTRRRDSVAVGYAITKVLALETSYFAVQQATYPPTDLPSPGLNSPDFFPKESGMRLKGFTLGPVLRWPISDRVSLFTKQTVVALRADETTWFNTGWTSHWSDKVNAYQASLGIDFRLGRRGPLHIGFEVNRAFVSRYSIANPTGYVVDLTVVF